MLGMVVVRPLIQGIRNIVAKSWVMMDINGFQNVRVIATPSVWALDLTDKLLLLASKYVRLAAGPRMLAPLARILPNASCLISA